MQSPEPAVPPIRESAKKKEILREMSFLEHLEDLRGVLVQSAVVYLVAVIGCWFLSERILDLLLRDLPVEKLVFFAPGEAFMARMKISLVGATLVSYPFILFRVWSFVSPALFDRERRKVYPFLLSASVLFYTGVVFAYLVIIPITLRFLLGFGTDMLTPMLSVGNYFNFVARISFTFGLVFQLPIVVFVLSLMGIVTPAFLLRQWRYAVVIIFVVAAVLTPPDATSQVLMAVPVLVLYIGSALLAHIALRRRDERERRDERARQDERE